MISATTTNADDTDLLPCATSSKPPSTMLTGFPDTSTTFRFMDLPPELRRQIFSYIFENKFYLNGTTINRYVTNALEGLPSICRTSPQIRAEAFVAYLRKCTINYSTYPRPNINQIQSYIAKYDLRVDFWHHVRRVHLILRFPTRSTMLCDGRVYNLLEVAHSLQYLELTFSGWPYLPSGAKILCAMGDEKTMELLAQRPKLAEVKISWTVNAPGWEHKTDIDDLRKDRASWNAAAKHIQDVFQDHNVLIKVTPWLESADRRLWEQFLVKEGS